MEVDKTEFEDIKKLLRNIKEFKDIEIKESWFYDIERLDDKIKEKQKFLRVVKRERKLQPTIQTQSPITKEISETKAGYQIMVNAKRNNILYCKDW